jgi:hypothetical protein
VIQALRQRQPALILRTRIQFGEAFVDAAMFAGQHLLHLIVVQGSEHRSI